MALLRGYATILLFGLLSLTAVVARRPLPPSASPPQTNCGYSVYIILTDDSLRPSRFSAPKQWYYFLVDSVATVKSNTSDRIIYVYHHAANGFAAKLTSEEAEKLSTLTGVLSIRKDRSVQLTKDPWGPQTIAKFGV